MTRCRCRCGWACWAAAAALGAVLGAPYRRGGAPPPAPPAGSLRVAADIGPRGARTVLLFLHGWPDHAGVYARQTGALCGDARCVSVELPGFAPGEPSPPAAAASPPGLDFVELADMLAASAAAARRGSPEGARVVLVSHDWGAWVGYVTEKRHPGAIDAMVPLDVGPGAAPREGENALVFYAALAGYQWLNVLCWHVGTRVPWVGPPAANLVLRAFAKGVMAPMWGMPTPTPWYEISYTMSYPYMHAWRHDGGLPAAEFNTYGYTEGEVPRVPTLFLAGTVGFPIHGDGWRSAINAKGDGVSRAVLLKGCHHWAMWDCAERVNDEVRRFLIDLGP